MGYRRGYLYGERKLLAKRDRLSRARLIAMLERDFKVNEEKVKAAIDKSNERWRMIRERAAENRADCCNRDGDL